MRLVPRAMAGRLLGDFSTLEDQESMAQAKNQRQAITASS
ncbi:hypothetical protein Pogu_1283 [Pyrobaculum oguniense TE7]|uniref:Uncharacterized protein n=1 Tax=Pyrobaculum oguniense (strain DSM 13380 / JCM 10595 / TE7) TaxID=698757 RepID=H6QAA9_PYROT|nr:hypothetical protein Pogu_1283 [Pyrobaculum oguniense TE7]